jgi:RNA polymerase sigma-70 factor (ECF subfamily)
MHQIPLARRRRALVSQSPTFRDFLSRVRAGDEEAATELVRLYEPELRRAVRVQLRDNRLRRLLDSMDVCQSVLASFFIRAALGQYELETPEQLLHLLARMARNKVVNEAHHQQAGRRDYRRLAAGGAQQHEVPGRDPTPSQIIAGRELLEEARRRLSPDERRLLELREQGRGWAEIAAELGGSPEALRKQLARAVERVAEALGLEGGQDD